MMRLYSSKTAILTILGAAMLPQASWAAAPSAGQALKLAPIQQGVDYDRPTAEQAAKCKMVAKKIDGNVGWIVEGPDGAILRKFVDTNGDNIVDQWSYYKDGLEVYRDIDFNYNGKADQFRWFHTGGSRWGLDTNEDGAIDSWKQISAEEVTSEIVAAIASHDAQRFSRLLITPSELKSLGLGKAKAESVAEKAGRASADFKAMTARQKTIAKDAVWVQFSANRPGIVPAGTDLSTKDFKVYENVVAIAESEGHNAQVQVGTLVQVGDTWRAIEMPRPMGEGQADATPGGFFFQASLPSRGENGPAAGGASEAMQKLLGDLEKLQVEAEKATTHADQVKYTNRRADLIGQIADAAQNPDDRAMWVRQLADMLGAAVQVGNCPDGTQRLKSLFEVLDKNAADKNLAAYVKFRQLTAAYVLAMQAPKADVTKVQADWIKSLEQFASDYPTAADAAEAMLQLAINQEFSGEDGNAEKWYSRIVKEFPDSPAAKKATGARARLDSVDKVLALSGQSPAGGTVDLAKYRGKVVLIQYWSARSSSSKADMASLKELWNKYGRQFTIVGVNLDNDVKDLNAYLADNPLPWPQIHEEGGSDSRLATQLGIFAVPTMILIDQQGKVVNRNVSVADLESEVKRLVK